MGSGFSKKKKQARMFQEQLTQFQGKLKTTEITGSAGNGLVTLKLSGEGEMTSIKIQPDCVDRDDIEGLEDLIKAAYNDAQTKVKSQSMPNIPGMPDLSNFGL